MSRMAAANTPKRRLIRTVPFVHGPAPVTCPRCSAWIDQHDGDTAHLRFIRDVLSKLEERPIAELSAGRFPSRFLSARAYVGQILEGKRATSAFGFLHKLLGSAVVGVGLEAALSAAQLPQATFGVFRANGLQAITTALIPLAYLFNVPTTIGVAVAIRGKVGYAEIDTQRTINIIARWFVNVARDKEIELTLAIDEIAFALSGLQYLALPFTAHKRDRLAVVGGNRPDRNRLLVKVEGQNTVIICNTAMRSVRALRLPVQLVAITDFGKATDDHLGRQAVLRLDALIDQLLQVVLPKHLLFPRHLANRIARDIRRFNGALQGISLFGRRLQFDLGMIFM